MSTSPHAPTLIFQWSILRHARRRGQRCGRGWRHPQCSGSRGRSAQRRRARQRAQWRRAQWLGLCLGSGGSSGDGGSEKAGARHSPPPSAVVFIVVQWKPLLDSAHVHERLIIFTVPIVINDGKLVPFVVGRRHKRDPPKLLQRRVPPAHRHLEGECLSCKTQRARVVRLGQRVVLSSMSQEGGREGGRLTRRSGSNTLARL